MAAKLKESFGKLSFLKSYSSLVVPIVIAVVGILIFVPTQLISNKLGSEIQQDSISKGSQIKSLIKVVPPKEQWKKERQYQQAYEEDAKQIVSLVSQTSERELLSYSIFPKPQETSRLIFQEFAQKYRQSIEGFVSSLNARDCPTQAEMQRSMGTSRQSSSTTKSEIEDVLCREKAQSISLYATPSLFAGYKYWENYKYEGIQKAVKDCWYWQVGYWIIEDVADTIASLNEGSTSVFTSPVKRLMYMRFSTENISFSSYGGKKREKGLPYYVSTLFDGLAIPCTGRFSNTEIDVVHFNVSVVVSSEGVSSFMKELCASKDHTFRGFDGTKPVQHLKHNQITILTTGIEPVDIKTQEHKLYRYGEDAVVVLNLVCEYVFDKKGYESIKPESVKKEQETGKKSSVF